MEWLEPWHPVSSSEEFTPELKKEVAPNHAMYGLPTKTIARRNDRDEVLFGIGDGSNRVAWVHLTWSAKQEPYKNVPLTIIYDSLDAWAGSGMVEDHKEYLGTDV